MNKAVQTVRKTKSLKPVAAPKRTAAPFSDKIPLIRSLILDSVKPGVIKKIYLFGSYAYGKPTKKSDIDLCVVIGNRFNTSSQYLKMALSLSENDIRPMDLIVYKENQIYNFKNPNGIESTILKKGEVLYG